MTGPSTDPSLIQQRRHRSRRAEAQNEHYYWWWARMYAHGYAVGTLEVMFIKERPDGAQGQEVKDA